MIMFTGIVQEMGEINKIEKSGCGRFFYVKAKNTTRKIEAGSSVCVSGVCLTARGIVEDVVSFELMPATLQKTTLALKIKGDRVNLEASLKVGDEIGGHFVYGHVDCATEVLYLIKKGGSAVLSVKLEGDLMKYIVQQGSVTVDGVSLTVSGLSEESFEVSLVGYTLENTTLGSLKAGDKVNLEADMLAKYVGSIAGRE